MVGAGDWPARAGAGELAGAGGGVEHYGDLAAVSAAVDDGLPVPGLVIVACPAAGQAAQPGAVRTPLPPRCWAWCRAGWLTNGWCRAGWWC